MTMKTENTFETIDTDSLKTATGGEGERIDGPGCANRNEPLGPYGGAYSGLQACYAPRRTGEPVIGG
jgi:hypothetical protein